jgi:hypothetical protein
MYSAPKWHGEFQKLKIPLITKSKLKKAAPYGFLGKLESGDQAYVMYKGSFDAKLL